MKNKKMVKNHNYLTIVFLSIIVLMSCNIKTVAQTAKDSISERIQTQTIESDSTSTTTQTTVSEKVYDVVDKMPEFPGGLRELMKFVSENIRYPYDAEKDKIQGRVLVSFTINSEGYAVNPKIIRGIMTSLDTEAIRIVKKMPRWKPGKKDGKAVAVKFTIPVVFQLVKRR